MRYIAFHIENYRAIEERVVIDLKDDRLIPLVGVNECGKTTILQAIYCFDYLNDSEYEGRHLKNVKNLYKTQDTKDPTVKALIEINFEELTTFYSDCNAENNKKQQKLIDAATDKSKIEELKKKIFDEAIPISKSSFNNLISIQRNLDSKKYSIQFNSLEIHLPVLVNENLAKYIVNRMPYILYNDDFMDRPPNYIEIPNEKPDDIAGWLAIFERLFKVTDNNYSLFNLAGEKDIRRRDSIISDVESTLNKTLTADWKKFSVTKNDSISIKIKFSPDEKDTEDKKHILNVQVVEKIKDRERYFDVIDRSKGFLWFFNFVMKLEFNPKVIESAATRTIYLLDEPGSYLHQAAQSRLCEKIVAISKNFGSVIYCTHSHKLLNPEYIPLNNIYIVEKDKNKTIKATPLPQIKTKTENLNAFQPIHEALQISALETNVDKQRVIAVEGIYDKYAIALMIDLDNSTFILPGTSADSIQKNIQFLNGFSKNYIAIWDNDEEGTKALKKASQFFGEKEALRFDFLPAGKLRKRRMEEMFEKSDMEMFKKELKLADDSNYESVISTLFYSAKKDKSRILSKISKETKENFKILNSIFNKRFENSKKLMSGME